MAVSISVAGTLDRVRRQPLAQHHRAVGVGVGAAIAVEAEAEAVAEDAAVFAVVKTVVAVTERAERERTATARAVDPNMKPIRIV